VRYLRKQTGDRERDMIGGVIDRPQAAEVCRGWLLEQAPFNFGLGI
jgi:hypothetical protein